MAICNCGGEDVAGRIKNNFCNIEDNARPIVNLNVKGPGTQRGH